MAPTVEALVVELAQTIAKHTDRPVWLFGHSWGAWLSYLLAFSRPEMLRKVFLIGSGAFDTKYVGEMECRRLSRLTALERAEYRDIDESLSVGTHADKDLLLERLGSLAGKADCYCVDDTPENQDQLAGIDGDVYQSAWSEGALLRKTGYLKLIADQITVPVRIIHGADDPTPIEGVVEPIRGRLRDLKWYRLERCGHSPWKERYAKDAFWRIVRAELS